MFLSDLALARRLERAEGRSCVSFAAARRRLFPDSGAEWLECAGAFVVFDGVDSPVTQSFGLGITEELTPAVLDLVERFFLDRGAPVMLEICPLAGVPVLDMLCRRNYRPVEISSVLYRPVQMPEASIGRDTGARLIEPHETQLWTDISSRGWTHEHPEYLDLHRDLGVLCSAREDGYCFLGEFQGQPGAAGALCLHDKVAVFAGASTVPELRRRGLQAALLNERMRFAVEAGCDLAMMVAEAGSNSQRNAERQGFRIAYTRTKWRLSPAA